MLCQSSSCTQHWDRDPAAAVVAQMRLQPACSPAAKRHLSKQAAHLSCQSAAAICNGHQRAACRQILPRPCSCMHLWGGTAFAAPASAISTSCRALPCSTLQARPRLATAAVCMHQAPGNRSTAGTAWRRQLKSTHLQASFAQVGPARGQGKLSLLGGAVVHVDRAEAPVHLLHTSPQRGQEPDVQAFS